MMTLGRRALLGAATASGLAAPALAQTGFPSGPVRFVVGFTAGGGTDTVARILATKLTEVWGVGVVVDNRPGAGGRIASEVVSRAKPDGSTVLFVSAGFAIDAALTSNLGFDPINGFTPLSLAASGPYVLVVNPGVPANSTAELIALARAQPGRLNAATAGPGSALDMAQRLFRSMAGVDIVDIAYGGSSGIADLVAGRVQMTIAALPQTAGPVRDGRLRALAVTTAQRSTLAPELPTIAESGLPGYDVTSWYASLLPAGTPEPIVSRMNADILAVLAEPETRARFAAAGMEPRGSTPAELGHLISSEIAQWKAIAQAANLSLN